MLLRIPKWIESIATYIYTYKIFRDECSLFVYTLGSERYNIFVVVVGINVDRKPRETRTSPGGSQSRMEKLEGKIPMVAMQALRDWRDNGEARIHG